MLDRAISKDRGLPPIYTDPPQHSQNPIGSHPIPYKSLKSLNNISRKFRVPFFPYNPAQKGAWLLDPAKVWVPSYGTGRVARARPNPGPPTLGQPCWRNPGHLRRNPLLPAAPQGRPQPPTLPTFPTLPKTTPTPGQGRVGPSATLQLNLEPKVPGVGPPGENRDRDLGLEGSVEGCRVEPYVEVTLQGLEVSIGSRVEGRVAEG